MTSTHKLIVERKGGTGLEDWFDMKSVLNYCYIVIDLAFPYLVFGYATILEVWFDLKFLIFSIIQTLISSWVTTSLFLCDFTE